RHTRCLSDWSSDVCSSDLGGAAGGLVGQGEGRAREAELGVGALVLAEDLEEDLVGVDRDDRVEQDERERVVAHQPREVGLLGLRSEERRVGKESGTWCWWI